MSNNEMTEWFERAKQTERAEQIEKTKLTERAKEANKLEKARLLENAELVKRTMLELSSAAQLPVGIVEAKEVNEAEQFVKAKRAMSEATGLYGFRVARNVVARGPWARRLFLPKSTKVKKAVTDEKRTELAQEVERLMRAEREKQAQLRKQLRALLDK